MIHRTRTRKYLRLILFFSVWLGLHTSSVYAQCNFTPATNCAGDACNATPTSFTYPGTVNPGDKFEWDFGETAIQTDTSTKKNPSYLYTKPGSYTVTLKVNGTVTCTQTVPIGGLNSFVIEPDINKGPQEEEICKQDLAAGVTLTPKFTGTAPANLTYLWSTGATTPTIQVNKEGCYSVTITDNTDPTNPNRCSRTNKVKVTAYKPDPNVPPPPQERGQWFFGNGAGIKFQNTPPEAITGAVNVPEGSSTVSNAEGKLLFYTDGKTIYQPDGTVMSGGTLLNGGTDITQGVLIVSQPGCASCNTVYYVFTISDTGELQYSIVDMRANNGAGAVRTGEKNIPLFPTSTERVTSVAAEPDPTTGANKTWVITHDANSSIFRVYPLDAKGIGSPVTSEVGAVHGPEKQKGESYIKSSPDGTRVAVAIPGGTAPGSKNLLQVFDFDKATGKLSNPKTVDLGTVPPSAYGVEFASDTLLYVTLTGTGAANPSQLLQYNVRSSDTVTIANSRKVIATSPQKYGALQIDPDKRKIYLAIEGATALGVINQPNDALNVDFKENGYALKAPAISKLGLPNVSPTETPPGFGQGFTYDGPPCATLGERVTYQFRASPDRAPRNDKQPNSFFAWVFPDGSTSSAQNPSYIFPGPGTYTVKLNIRNDCNSEPGEDFQQTIVINRAPDPFQIQPASPNAVLTNGTITTCEPSLSLRADGNQNLTGITYRWFKDGQPVVGSNNTLPSVTQSGVYSVLAINGTCGRRAQVNVVFSSPQVNLGPDIALCGGNNQITLNAGNPGSSYAWRLGTGSLGPVIGTEQTLTLTVAPGSTNTYSVTVTNPAQPTCPGTDEIVIRSGSPSLIRANARPTAATCAGVGTNTGEIELVVPATEGPFTYAWTGPNGFTASAPVLTGLAAGVYQATVTNGAGCQTVVQASVNSTSSTLNYSVNTPVTAACGSPATGTLSVLPTPPPGISFVWRNSNGQPVGNTNVLTAAPGIYSVELADNTSGCKQFLSNLTIVADANQPIVKIAPPVYTACNNIQLYASATVGNYFEWKKITNNNQILPPDQISIIGYGSTPPLITQITEIERYTVSVWKDLASYNTPGSCFGTDIVTVLQPPILTPENMFTANRNVACVGDIITLTAISPPAGATYQYTYQWQKDEADIPGAIARTYQVTDIGANQRYRVIIRIPQFNCSPATSNTRTINIIPFPDPNDIELGGNNPICLGEAAPLRAGSKTGITYTYRWVNKSTGRTESNTSILAVTPPTTTIYVLTISNGTAPNSCSITKEITVNVNPVPVVDFSNQIKPFCEGDFVDLNATNPGGATYAWKRNGEVIAGETRPTLRVRQAGDYSVTVTVGQCTATAQKTINAPLKPPVPAPPRKVIEFCFKEEPGTLAPVDAGPGTSGLRYTWYNLASPTAAIGTGQTFPVGPGSYRVKYTNNENCVAYDTITVLDKCGPRLFIPDAFTPNGDGNNDVFVLRHPGFIRNLEFRIYNRWGEVVAVTRLQDPVPDADGSIPVWDGTFKGKASPVGSYVWTVSYESTDFPERAPIKRRGGLSLIR